MLISVPGQKNAGKTTRALVEFVDIYPSLCEAAGLPVPGHLEGTSVLPLIDDPGRAWKSAAFSQYPRGRVMGYSMRTDRWRYTEWIERKPGKVVARELYDHQADPGENTNVAAANPDVVKKLSAQLEAGWRAAKPR
jgi:arylsulfatase A-like enzyme